MKTLIILIIGVFLFLNQDSLGCAVPTASKTSLKKIDKIFAQKKRSMASSEIKPFAENHPNPSWESRLGNVLLNYQLSRVGRVTLSIPARLKRSSHKPFGDEQSNAKMDLDSTWSQSTDFPVVGIESVQSGKVKRIYLFDKSLNVKNYSEKLLTDGWIEVTPINWKNSFYFNFQTGILPIRQFVTGIPEAYRTFPKNRIAPNIAKIEKANAFDQLKNTDLGLGYNKTAWFNDNVHGRFPTEDGEVTARGGVVTWGIKTNSNEEGSFKNLYTCFQARDVNLESDKKLSVGVPSGAGWHNVGNAAESVLNDLNENPIPFAVGRTHGKTNTAYGMEETITAIWLQTDEIQVTRQGEFHWYLNPYEENVCTEIWVHNCLPDLNNSWGMNCHYIGFR
jgi:hypothetical protein